MKKTVNLLIAVICLACVFTFKSQAVSGKTGELTWSYDEVSAVLTISGNGEMENFSSETQVPWHEYMNSIKNVKLEAGVRSIGSRAFSSCVELTHVSFTDSVEKISNAAFYNCTNLVSVAFTGTDFYWNRISVGKNNEYFTSAAVMFSSNDHVHTFKLWETAEPASINQSGVRKSDCNICNKVSIEEEIYAIRSIDKSQLYFTYTGKQVNPELKIIDTAGFYLNSGTDYTVTFKDKVNPGKHKAVVVFKGKYTGTYTFYYYILPSKVTNLNASCKTDSITLSWDKVTGATGYRIYIYDAASKTYSVLVKKTSATSYKITNLKKAKNYAFLVRAYIKYDGGYYYSKYYAKIITCTKTDKCNILKVSQSTSAVSITWNKVKGATGYRVFLYDTSLKKYKALKTTTGTAYRCENLKSGTAYVFAVRAYKKISKQVVWSDITTFSAATRPKTPTGISADACINAVSLSWKSSQGATGYRIYSYDFNKRKYVPLKVVKSTKVTIYSLEPAKKHVFLVRPYISLGDDIIWGASAKISFKTQKDSASAVTVSASGKKYHRPNCPYAKSANEKMSVATAVKRGYTACSHCF